MLYVIIMKINQIKSIIEWINQKKIWWKISLYKKSEWWYIIWIYKFMNWLDDKDWIESDYIECTSKNELAYFLKGFFKFYQNFN